MIHLLADNFWGLNPDIEQGAEATTKFIAAPEAWVVFFLAVGLFAFVLWIYRREGETASPAWRTVCGLLRFCAIALLLVVLFQPALVSTHMRTERKSVAILIDRSLSMNFTDTYESDSDVVSLATALGILEPGEELNQTIREEVQSLPRLEVLNRLMDKQGAELMRELSKTSDVKVYTFDGAFDEAERKPALPGAEPTADAAPAYNPYTRVATDPQSGLYTRLGEALSSVVEKFPPQKLGGIVAFTDGRSNSGRTPDAVVDSFQFSGIPVYFVGLGDYHEPKDIEILNRQNPERVQIKVVTSFSVDVKAMNFDGQDAALSLTMLERKKPGEDWTTLDRVVETRNVALPGNETLKKEVFTYKFLESEIGEYRMRLAINPEGSPRELPGEITKKNNVIDFTVEVISDKLNVLYLEGYPRYEFRYLKNAMLRDRDNLAVHCFNFSADADFPQECSPGLEPIVDFQSEFRSLEKLVEYDCVILGDVEPALLPVEFRQNLLDFVQRFNGGLIFIAGEFYMPRGYRDTPLYSLLPIVVSESSSSSYSEVIENSFRAELTAEGRESTLTRLVEDRDQNIELWEDHDQRDDGLPGFYWYYRDVVRAAPGATVLVAHPVERTESGDAKPIIVTAQNGSGYVVYVGTDDVWRWRWLVDDLYMYRFYRNSMTFATGGRLLSSKRFEITTNKDLYAQNEKIDIQIRALDKTLRPFMDVNTGDPRPTYPITLIRPDGQTETLDLELGADDLSMDNGTYKGSFKPDALGAWRLELKDIVNTGDEAAEESVRKTVEVFTKSLEDKYPKMDRELLTNLAEKTHARFFFPWEIGEMGRYIDSQPRQVQGATRTDDLWDSPFMFLLALLMLAAEWTIRKWKRLA